MATYLKIKQFGDLVAQANRLGSAEVKLSRAAAVELLNEITKLALEKTAQPAPPAKNPTPGYISGGKFS